MRKMRFETNEKEKSLFFTLSSERASVNSVICETISYLKRFDFKDSISLKISLKLVLRELLLNAILHGNKNIKNRKVTCEITFLKGPQFKVVVEDQGEGFDYKNLNMRIPRDPSKIRQRGYILINACSKKIKFNNKGNQVQVILYAKKNTNGEENKIKGGKPMVFSRQNILRKIDANKANNQKQVIKY